MKMKKEWLALEFVDQFLKRLKVHQLLLKSTGYSMSLSGVFETAMEDAIIEFKEISGLDYHDIEKTNLNNKWKKSIQTYFKEFNK